MSRYDDPADLHTEWDDPQLRIDRLHEAAILCAKHRSQLAVARWLEAKEPVPWEAVAAREAVIHHDVAAFVEETRSRMHPAVAQRFHAGLTSSDLSDTAQSMLIHRSSLTLAVLAHAVDEAGRGFCERIGEIIVPGSTHGQAADKLDLRWRIRTDIEPIARIGDVLRVGFRIAKASGPVGISGDLGVHNDWLFVGGRQCIPRYYYAQWCSLLVELSLMIEQAALNIRLASRFPHPILREARTPGQMGSSSMPDKTNPIRSERLCGLASRIRSDARCVQDASVLWEERDISHSSVERTALRDAVVLTSFCLSELAKLYTDVLEVDPAGVRARVGLHPYDASEAYDILVNDRGMTRAEAYGVVQQIGPRNAIEGVQKSLAVVPAAVGPEADDGGDEDA